MLILQGKQTKHFQPFTIGGEENNNTKLDIQRFVYVKASQLNTVHQRVWYAVFCNFSQLSSQPPHVLC